MFPDCQTGAERKRCGVLATIDREAISGAETFLAEGDGFMRVVVNAHKRPKIFTTELTFNMLTMAIEKHAMAILMSRGKLPENHTFMDLLDGLKWVVPVSEANHALLLTLHAQESMCSLEVPAKPRIPESERLQEYIGLGLKMQAAAREMLSGGGEPSYALE